MTVRNLLFGTSRDVSRMFLVFQNIYKNLYLKLNLAMENCLYLQIQSWEMFVLEHMTT